ncbi:MAG: glycosyltransferase family 4 protein [Anaerolineales bacterium]|nr:glycosyltransferase family 4 protein [Anaerolineales bacterium]
MRIALVTPGFSLNENDWAIPALLNLARALAGQHELHVFSQRYPPRGLYPFSNLTHHAIGGGQKFGLTSAKIWLQTAQAIIRQHQKTPFDLLHAFWADEAGFSAALAGSRLGRPVVVSLGGGELTNLPDINYGAQRFLIRRLTTAFALKGAALVTAGSTYQLNLCRAHAIPESKLRLAPLGVDTELFQPASLIPLPFTIHHSPFTIHHFNLIQAASLLPVKNHRLLLEILAQVKKEIPQIKLNLAGSGPLQNDLVALADQLDLQANLIWQQHVAYPAMPRLYQQSHLYLQTSRHESQGMAVLEAMACGVPVLGTPVGVVPEVACLPPQGSAEALAAQVIEVFSDETRYQKLRGQARQRAETAYSLAVTTQNFLKIYRNVLNPS